MYARLRCGGNLPLCVRGLGTRNRLLRYRICVPCSKRLPGVRDAFSEALRAQNRLLGYGRDIRYRKRPPTVRDASSKASRTADSTNCGQPPAAPDASSVRETTRSDVSRHKKKEGDLSVYQDFLELPAAPVLLPPHAYIAASAPSSKKIKKEDVFLGKVLEYTPFLAVSSNLPTYVSVGIYHSRIFLKS